MNEYEKLLARARSQVPEDAFKKSGERFKVPKVQLIVQGNRSIWQNFQEIISILNRPGKEVLKFVAGQLATAGIFEGSAAIFN
ncbi:MAG: translation initiation factor IF-2 subunit beta, partial [Candidatus Thorarchaeota archaeon]